MSSLPTSCFGKSDGHQAAFQATLNTVLDLIGLNPNHDWQVLVVPARQKTPCSKFHALDRRLMPVMRLHLALRLSGLLGGKSDLPEKLCSLQQICMELIWSPVCSTTHCNNVRPYQPYLSMGAWCRPL